MSDDDRKKETMSDEKITALIAEARSAQGGRFYGPISDNPDALDLIARLADALEAVQQTPAVDKDALTDVIRERFNIARGRGGVVPLALADQILASGILLDAAKVEARGREALREKILKHADEDGLIDQNLVANIGAQRVREGN